MEATGPTRVLVLDDALLPDQLGQLVATAEAATFEAQALGPQGIRSRERSVVTDVTVSEMLWSVIRQHLPTPGDWYSEGVAPSLDPPVASWKFTGCNPRSRFYRYRPGASFSPHVDEPWRPGPAERSLLTLLLYLPAGGCEGGETVVDGKVVQAVDGRIVLFDHGVPHEGRPVERGTKLVLRSDVMAGVDP